MSSPDGPTGWLNFQAVLQARQAARATNLQPASARHVLEVVAGYSNGHPARPSYQTLADDTGLGSPQVRRLLAGLVAAGYLTLSRRPTGRPGWDQPQWALGPLCNVSATAHSEVEVSRRVTQSEPTRALQSEPRRAQKRESVDQVGGVVQGNGGGGTAAAAKREGEEKGKRKTYDGARVREMADALKDAGFPTTSMRDARERAAVLASPHPVAAIAACLVAMRDGDFGDRYDQEHLTPAWATRRTEAFLNRTLAHPPANGRPPRGAAALQFRPR